MRSLRILALVVLARIMWQVNDEPGPLSGVQMLAWWACALAIGALVCSFVPPNGD